MNLTTSLSFLTCYYLRKILLQNSKDLQWTLNQNNGFCNNSSEDLNQLLESVYLEDVLAQLLKRLYAEEKEVSIKVKQLEDLCLVHQSLVAKNLLYSEELLNVQQQIFWILGFKRIEIKISEVVDALNQLSKYSSSYLGAKITTNNWQSNRPNSDWLNNFSIEPSAKFVVPVAITETVENFVQLQDIHKWVTAFVLQYTKIFRDFPNIIEQKKLGEVKTGLLLTNIGVYSAWLNVETKVTSKLLIP